MSRLNELLQQAGNIGRNKMIRSQELGFSEKYFQALEFLKGRMQELGMQVETDRSEIFMAYCRGVTRKQNPL